MRITEIKRHLDGREERYVCDLIDFVPGRAVVRFVWERDEPLRDGPIDLPAGESVTHAYFWKGRHYLVYTLMSSEGEVYGHRFDICDDVHISLAGIRWTDLLLDLWVDPAGEIHVLDEHEVDQARAAGLLTERRLTIIAEAKAHLLAHYRRVLQEIAGLPPR